MFPQSGVLDTFTAPNGPLSSAWQDLGAGYRISNNQMRVNSGDQTALWNTAFGSAQEAYVTMSAIDASATEFDLVLKAQGNSWSNGALTLFYYPAGHFAQIWTYSPGQSWQQHGLTYALNLQPGDVFGGRIYNSGLVEMYHNGAIIAAINVSSWLDAAKPSGRAGVWMIDAPNMIMDNFGAGNVPNCNRTISSNVNSVTPTIEEMAAVPTMGVQMRASAESGVTRVTWSTYRTPPVTQFRVLRSDSADRTTAVEVNVTALTGEPVVRGNYSFVDPDTQALPAQATRTYWLQVVYADGHQEELGPIAVPPLLSNTMYLPLIWR